jgi:glycosyltransferase involved in cell wall biosynthesis
MNITPRHLVVHIVPHLGGGVGKALLGLVRASAHQHYQHDFILLESPEKTSVFDSLEKLGCTIRIKPAPEEIVQLIALADIVQLEWWCHPATFAFLCTHALPPHRLVLWSHHSGLFPPYIPSGLLEHAQCGVFSSPCSLRIPQLKEYRQQHFTVISSGSGLSPAPHRPAPARTKPQCGYLGTLSAAKMHPEIVNFLSAVAIPDFSVGFWGDPAGLEQLKSQCEDIGKPQLLQYHGFATDPAQVLQSLEIFPYLLNPIHYGTAENALLEAMSAEVVPIVLRNPAEMAIVSHGITGLIVSSPQEFNEAILYLYQHPEHRMEMGKRAREYVLSTFTPERTAASFARVYDQLLDQPKQATDYQSFLGNTPHQWYSQCYAISPTLPLSKLEIPHYLEKTKGSLQHFLRYFPNCTGLLNLQDKIQRELSRSCIP